MFECAACSEKLDALSRRTYNQGAMNFVADVALLLVDEVHLLCDDRGPTLEAGVVCRLRALGTLPQLAAAPLARLRLLAVSATIPNVRDVAAWLGVRPEGCKQFGEEMRPVQIATHVRGFPAAKNDFLFERSLNDRVFAVVLEHWAQKPVLAFCSSRKGAPRAAHCAVPAANALYAGSCWSPLVHNKAVCTTAPHPEKYSRSQTAVRAAAGAVDCAHKVQAAAQSTARGGAAFFVRNDAQAQALAGAAAAVQDRALAAALPHGVAWHHAAMEPADRTLVEQLFLGRHVMFLAATATLAQARTPRHCVVLCHVRHHHRDTLERGSHSSSLRCRSLGAAARGTP